jgi:GTP-binding protein HflX
MQHRDRPHIRTFIGPGKAEEIAQAARALNAQIAIFDVDLSPSQQRNLGDIFGKGTRVIDRTGIILDIFAKHAHSAEGKLQVELAQLNYLLPRLKGMWTHLERQSGAGMSDRIGTRGPGETQLETDKRIMRKRIQRLNQEIEAVKKNRSVQRKQRKKQGVFNIALVGYTNTGKSTLLNALTGAGVQVEDKLFATLDSTTRKLSLEQRKREIVITDTVGFIKKLPHQLVAAFRSTLDEVTMADLLLHVVDAGHPQMESQIRAVEVVLKELDSNEKPQLLVFNKTDTINESDRERLKKVYPGSVQISAVNNEGLDELLEAIQEHIKRNSRRVHLLLPYNRGDLVQRLHNIGLIEFQEHTQDGTEIIADIPEEETREFMQFFKP